MFWTGWTRLGFRLETKYAVGIKNDIKRPTLITDGNRLWRTRNSPDLVWDSVDSEVVLINLTSGKYFAFNKPASQLWSEVIFPESLHRFVPEEWPELGVLLKTLRSEGVLAEQAELPSGKWPLIMRTVEDPVVQVFSDLAEMIKLDPIHDVDPNAGWPSVANSDG